MIERRGRMAVFMGAGAMVLATAFAGCASMGGSHIDCNIVKLQSQSGRSSAEIASALGVSESDVDKCPRGRSRDWGRRQWQRRTPERF